MTEPSRSNTDAYQVVIQGDDGDQVWQVDQEVCLRWRQAENVAVTLLGWAERMVTRPPDYPEVTLRAYVYKGWIVGHEEPSGEPIFEVDESVPSQLIEPREVRR